jgi:hypothetical protein
MRYLVAVVGLAFCAACQSAPAPDLTPTLGIPAEGALADNGCPSDPSEAVVWDFDWSDVPGATSYELWVKHRSSQEPEIHETGLQTSSHRAGRFAMLDGEHLQGWEWKVRAEVNGAYQPWSRTAAFNVEPPDTDCR